jgi:peptidoglycan biosynthesis protein MviN/MurJ (putative lipid II flippase)
LPPATVNIAMRVVPAFVILVPLGMLTSLFSAWMLAAGRHSNTLMEGVPALAIIIAVLLFANGGIEPLIWGTVAGHILYMISLTIPLQRHREIEAPCFSRKSDQWVWFWHSCGIMLGGQALLSMITVIDQFFAVHLGSGAIATLSYSDRIMALLLGLGGTAVSRATLPVFSRAQESGGAQVRKVAMRWMHLMLILGILSAAMAWWLAPFAVKLIFQRGAFSAQDSMAVAAVLRYAVVQLPFYFAGLVLVSYLVSRGLHKYVAIGACVNFLVKLGGNYLFIPLMGLNGIVVATTSMYIVSFIMLYRLARGQDAMKSEI